MTLGLHDSRRRRRRQIQWRFIRWLLIIGGIIAAGVFAYETGSRLAAHEVTIRDDKIVELNGRIQDLQDENAKLASAAAAADKARQESDARYQADVPTGQLAEVLETVRSKLEAGVTMERLAFLLAAAENTRSCDEDAPTKRFILRTSMSRGGNDSVGFADNRIIITGEGETATNDAGQVEAWFDPAKPITLHFTQVGGKKWSETAELPLHKSIVIADSEYRFSATAGKRGFVEITGERCDYP